MLDGEGVIRWSYLSPVDVNPGADGILAALEAFAVPAEFSKNAKLVDKPLTLDPATIEANRIDWTERWAKVALR